MVKSFSEAAAWPRSIVQKPGYGLGPSQLFPLRHQSACLQYVSVDLGHRFLAGMASGREADQGGKGDDNQGQGCVASMTLCRGR
jgi:hypothetical protein